MLHNFLEIDRKLLSLFFAAILNISHQDKILIFAHEIII